MKCPVCKSELTVGIKLEVRNGKTVSDISIDAVEDISILKEALFSYWRWVAEGKKKYKEEQWYYDIYHDYIEYLPEEDAYRFSIQTFDSPEGDEWWRGKFKLNNDGSIEILPDKTKSTAR